ncbi:hypothetical protein caldi_12020 [Caldinitratiruptor microaerophilus]|uniref:Uncharacterized protein n=1 Tax=Caldinitratiruptor microaerophilus TaxID=671077 RepID=A0AA35CJ94_9FIRM|nr:hypothetical protein caldi_12020 [Caldinitratiruptor microaerophilus]
MCDGNTIFALSVGGGSRLSAGGVSAEEDTDIAGSAAADALVIAIINALESVDSIPGFPSL